MATRTYSSPIEHSSDATFRAWGSELSSNLAACGLVQTADAGQINWTTVLRPAANTAAGFEMWRLANSSLFFKLEYGSNASVSTPAIWLTVGRGSDGNGNLTGQTSTRKLCSYNGGPTSTVDPYVTRICVTTDAFALTLKSFGFNASLRSLATFAAGPLATADGAISADGFGVLYAQPSWAFQSVRSAAPAATYAESAFFGQVPGNVTSSLTPDGKTQTYHVWANVPETRPFPWANIVILTEYPQLTAFDVAMVGNVSHTYLSIGKEGQSPINGNVNYGLALIYE